MQNTRKKGEIGENIACFYLEKHGFFIQERNYFKKWGEIDIIATKDYTLHFFEVKSITDWGNKDKYRPEENVHEIKLRRLRRIIQTYLNEKKYEIDVKFKFHVVTVRTNPITKRSKVSILENLIL